MSNQTELYVSTDIESDGPIPGVNSMISFGSAAYLAEKTLVSSFTANLETLQKEDIAKIVSNLTGIPEERILEDEANKILNIENTLNEKIIGQKEGVMEIANTLKRASAGLNSSGKPIGSFLSGKGLV